MRRTLRERKLISPQYDPKPRRRNAATPWIIALAIGVAAIFGLIFLGNYTREQQDAANPPAVIATPVPAAQRPALAPETTTGRRATPVQPQR
jgi:hypothetical protein